MAVNDGVITLNDLRTIYSASGTYSVLRDQTVQPRTPVVSSTRLVYGFSKSGLINAPFFIEKEDYETAKKVYGDVDTSLERRGSWFHRSINYCLDQGNVLALNLLKTNNEVDALTGEPTANADVSDYRSFSTDPTALNGNPTSRLLASYYKKQRFWSPDSKYLLATRKVVDEKSIFNLANISQRKLSFVVRKAQDVSAFKITALEWYGTLDKVPAFVRPTDLISDYFVDVFVLAGDFGPNQYPQLQTDPIYGQFFDGNGLIISKFDTFLTKAPLIRKYTGCLIPKFVDKDGTPYAIDRLINGETVVTGVLCAIDETELGNYDDQSNVKFLDLVGHRLLNIPTNATNFLSYKRKLSQDFTLSQKNTNTTNTLNILVGATVVSNPGKFTVTINSNNPNFVTATNELNLNTIFKGAVTPAGTTAGITLVNPVLYVTKIQKTTSQIVFDLSNDFKSLETPTSGSFVNIFDNGPTVFDFGSLNVGDTINITQTGPVATLASYTILLADTNSTILAALLAAVNGTTGLSSTSATVTGNLLGLSNSLTGATTFNVQINAGPIVSVNTGTDVGHAIFNLATPIVNYIYEITNDRFKLDGTSTFYLSDLNSQFAKDYYAKQIQNGDVIKTNTLTHYLKIDEVYAIGGLDAVDDNRKLLKVSSFLDADLTIPIAASAAIAFGASYDSSGYAITTLTLLNIISMVDSINIRLNATVVDIKTVRIPIANESDIKIGQYLVGTDTDGVTPMMARITSIRRVNIASLTPNFIEVTCDVQIKVYTAIGGATQVQRYVALKDMYLNYDVTALNGYVLKPTAIPNNTNQRMKEILSVMTDTSIADALVDPEMTDFRFVVDTFNHGLEPFSKSKISNLIRKRQKCFGLLNTPSFLEFTNNVNPRFTDTPDPVNPLPELNVKYISTGGNVAENPTFLYSLPEEEQGASFISFFAPNLKIVEDSGNEIFMPPAAICSNNYITSFRGNPFKPVGGPNRGVLSGNNLAGLEYEMSKTERGYLEEFGINPIMRKNDGRLIIMGNETSYKKFVSVLNFAYARNTVINLQIDIENILFGFTYEYNDDTLRTQVESSLTTYLQNVRDGFGAITTFKLIFDRTNNPSWLTSTGTALVDIEVQLPDIAKKFINRITLTRGNNPVVGAFTSI